MLSTDENDQYQLSKVNPPLNQTTTDALLEELNKDGTNGLNKFAIGMSKYEPSMDFLFVFLSIQSNCGRYISHSVHYHLTIGKLFKELIE